MVTTKGTKNTKKAINSPNVPAGCGNGAWFGRPNAIHPIRAMSRLSEGELSRSWHMTVEMSQGETPVSFPKIPERDEELAYGVIGVAIEVHRHLGPGFLESIYRKALHYELGLRGMIVESERRIPVAYKDMHIDG